MANNNEEEVDPEHPLIFQHPHIRAFHDEFNRFPRLIDLRDDAFIVQNFTDENSGVLDPPGIVPENNKHCINRFRLWMFNHVLLKCVEEAQLQRYRTAYMAVVYFERFLSLHCDLVKENEWVINAGLICLMLAGKIEEGRFPYRPVTSQVQDFSMLEVLFLDMSGWRADLVTPMRFMNFFIRKFQNFPISSYLGNSSSMTAAFIFTSLKVNGTLEFRPSVVAAAATLAAMDPNLTRAALEEKLNASPASQFGFIGTAEEVYRCYASINELDPYQELVLPAPVV